MGEYSGGDLGRPKGAKNGLGDDSANQRKGGDSETDAAAVKKTLLAGHGTLSSIIIIDGKKRPKVKQVAAPPPGV
jgi:hypothetical protein